MDLSLTSVKGSGVSKTQWSSIWWQWLDMHRVPAAFQRYATYTLLFERGSCKPCFEVVLETFPTYLGVDRDLLLVRSWFIVAIGVERSGDTLAKRSLLARFLRLLGGSSPGNHRMQRMRGLQASVHRSWRCYGRALSGNDQPCSACGERLKSNMLENVPDGRCLQIKAWSSFKDSQLQPRVLLPALPSPM